MWEKTCIKLILSTQKYLKRKIWANFFETYNFANPSFFLKKLMQKFCCKIQVKTFLAIFALLSKGAFQLATFLCRWSLCRVQADKSNNTHVASTQETCCFNCIFSGHQQTTPNVRGRIFNFKGQNLNGFKLSSKA